MATQAVQNPYASVDPSSQLSRFQKWLDKIGLTNYAGKAQYANDLNKAQWDSEYALRQSDLEYNSPSEQADRMRQAGLNPDILGVGQFEGNTAGNPMSAPASPAEELQEPISQIGRGIFNGLQLALAMKTGLAQIKSLDLDNAKKQFEVIRGIAGESAADASKYGDSLNLSGYKTLLDSLSRGRHGRKMGNAINAYFDFLSSSKRFGDKNWYEGLKEQVASRRDYIYEAADPMDEVFDEDFIKSVTDFNRLQQEASDIAREAENSTNKYRKADSDYGLQIGDYKSNRDYQKSMQDYSKKIQDKMNDFYKNLEGKDSWWSKAILLGIMMQNQGLSIPGAGLAGDVVRTAVTHRIPFAKPR